MRVQLCHLHSEHLSKRLCNKRPYEGFFLDIEGVEMYFSLLFLRLLPPLERNKH